MTDFSRRTTLGLMAAGIAAPGLAAPRARLVDPYWQGFGAGPAPDHHAWDGILTRHLRSGADGIARFDYGRASTADVAGYIDGLASLDPTTLRSADAFAYWVNLYNAVTVRTVLEAYPVASIRDIGGGLFSSGPWRDKRVTVAGRKLSLDDIEHGILRPIWRDPRIHYVVNCASLGCPNLHGRAFVGPGLDASLTEAAVGYINHPRAAQVRNGRLIVSSIYDWYGADFGGNDAGVIAHLKQFAKQPLAGALAGVTKISAYDYDWRLNG